jgi:hypothetical protein
MMAVNFGTFAVATAGHHLGAVLGDAARLVFLAHHVAGDVLQEQQRDAALAGELDEMRRLERGFGEQHAVVGEDRDRVAVQVREAGHQRGAVVGLELVQLRAVDDARDDLAHVVGLARLGRDHAVDFLGRVERVSRFLYRKRDFFLVIQIRNNSRTIESACESFERVVVRYARDPRYGLRRRQVLPP